MSKRDLPIKKRKRVIESKGDESKGDRDKGKEEVDSIDEYSDSTDEEPFHPSPHSSSHSSSSSYRPSPSLPHSSSLDDYNYGTLIFTSNRVSDDIDWSKNEWIRATATRNYLLDDGFLDLLEMKSYTFTKVKPDYQNEYIKTTGSSNRNPKNFITALLSQGNKFEAAVIKLLRDKVGSNNIKDIGGGCNPRSKLKYDETIEAMKQGIPIITQGIVRNYSNKTHGIPDLLVRSDWVNRLFDDSDPLTDKEEIVSAPKLSSRGGGSGRSGSRRKKKSKTKGYHYVVLDVKYKTLHLTSDGNHLRNDGPMKAYKGQLWVYNQAVGEMQGYTPPAAFILGRKWKFVQQSVNYSGNSCLDCLGRIDYTGCDLKYISNTQDALRWIRLVREEGDEWDLNQRPLPRSELYPNMCNKYDFPYHKLKSKFAEDLNELTIIWKCGPKQRKIAHSNGIYSWKDPRCTPSALGVGGKTTPTIMSRILRANHLPEVGEGEDKHGYVCPRYIKNNWNGWKNKQSLEFFVDFEMTCGVFSEFNDLPLSNDDSIIFLIGVGHIDRESNQWTFKIFLVESLDGEEEKRICLEFIAYINTMCAEYKCWDPPLYHWSPAEPSTWKRSMNKHSIISPNLNWSDMLKIFHKEPIAVKGCLNYSLKTIAKAFYKYKFIPTVWDTGSSCADGADAALGAYQVDKECKRLGTSFVEAPLTREIVKYNEVDCKVLQEMLYYLRIYHVREGEVEEDGDREDGGKEEDGKSVSKRRLMDYIEEEDQVDDEEYSLCSENSYDEEGNIVRYNNGISTSFDESVDESSEYEYSSDFSEEWGK